MSDPIDNQWWSEAHEGRRYEAVTRVVRGIRQSQSYRKANDLRFASLYANRPVAGFGIGSSREGNETRSRIALNVVRNMVGAVTSKIAAKNKPKPTFLTEGGDYELREKAQKLEKFVGGVFYETGIYGLLPKCFRDACVFGTGFLHVYAGDGKVEVERARPVEVVIDDMEAIDGNPPNIYRRKYVDRMVLKHRWAKDNETLANAIDAVTGNSDDTEYAYQTSADQVLVTEAWHIGEGDDVKGRHTITIANADLLDEEWSGPAPLIPFRWSEDIEGFFGIGLAEELSGIQDEINKLLQQIQRGHHLIAGHYLVQGDAKVQTQHLNNDLASIVRYEGVTPPAYQVPSIIAGEVYNHLWQLYAKAFEITGVSQMNATGQKPAGLDSGVAQRTYQDIQTERFLEVGQNYEEWVIEVARQVVRCAKQVGGRYKVRSVDKSDMEMIDWSEVDIKEDLYVIRVYPTSMIPSTPAGKLQWAQEMIASQVIPPDDVLDIIDFPDTEAYAKRKNAPRKLIERNVAAILKDGTYLSPEPFDNHQLALKLVNESYHEARLDGVPEAKLELLRRYMADTSDFLTPPPAPQPVGMQAPPGAPMPPMGAPPPMMPGPPMGPPMGQAA